jgi:hypothetical protein
MIFYVGLHQPSDAKRVPRCFISVNRVRGGARKAPLGCPDWIMDCGGFTELSLHGGYRHGPDEYAAEVNRWAAMGGLTAAVSQDYMCEPFMLKRTGMTVAEHQWRTIERYVQLRELVRGTYLMPVLQGYSPQDYVSHVEQYGALLTQGAYVGVGSVCKRNGRVEQVEAVLGAIRSRRPDLRLHGFGLKVTALGSDLVRSALHSADSMAWSYAARKQGRNQNCWREATRWARQIDVMPVQLGWGF